jgi:predicted N-acetyltransferase YhbS
MFGTFYIHACQGAEHFVRRQIEASQLCGDSFYTVAVDGEPVVGCVELRTTTEGVCINYVAVASTHGNRRLGTALLRLAMTRAETDSVFLEVVATNSLAIDWYTRLGFRPTNDTRWLAMRVPVPSSSVRFHVSGLPQALACQDEFGFGEFHVHSQGFSARVGLLGTEWFVVSPDGVSHPAIAAALQKIDDKRTLLVRVHADAAPSSHILASRELVRTRRMAAEVRQVRTVLDAR